MSGIDRRDLLVAGATVALGSLFSPVPAASQTKLLRRNVATMAPDDPILESYRRAIVAMRGLPPSDPRNWTRQAQIHRDICPHGNWFFLPWHRAYLVAFERICRQLSGDANFALPYWDWTANPQLPAVFASPQWKGSANPLFDSSRISQTVTIPTNVSGVTVIASILAESNFEDFASTRPSGQNDTKPVWQRRWGISGPLESNPHNQVHVRVGGNMGQVPTGALDPIFWLHHCNVDRLWDQWNRQGRANTNDLLWSKFEFTNQFVVPAASGSAPFNVSVDGLLDIGSLGYQYAPDIHSLREFGKTLLRRPIDLSGRVQFSSLSNIPPARINVPLNMPVILTQQQSISLERIRPEQISLEELIQFQKGGEQRQSAGRVVAVIRNIDPPKSGNAEVRVFVNCPYLGPDVPPEDRHYAGAFTFFGTDHAGHGEDKPSYLIDLTDTILRIRQGQPNVYDQINVQLMPVALPGGQKEGVEFRPGSVDVAII